MLNAVTPYDIDQLSVDQVLDLVQEPEGTKPNKSARLNLIKLFYKLLGFELSADSALALLDDPKNQLIIATAGSGKTTLSQIKVIIKKVIHQMKYGKPLYGNRVLCLVYNEHNTSQMEDMHKRLVSRIRNSGIQGFDIDDVIKTSTIHAFCNKWREEYKIATGTSGATLIMEAQALNLLKDSYKRISKKYGTPEFNNFPELYKVYCYAKECLLAYDDPVIQKKFPEVNLSPLVLSDLFKLYDSLKSVKKCYDFIDMLTKVYDLLRTNEDARERVQGYYDYVVVDEFQDSTPLMQEIIRLIVGDKDSLFIGDEDQSIYSFKGADINSILKFTELYEGGKVYVLNINRRCGRNIVNMASNIIEMNKNRFNKKLLASKDGGEVSFIGYSTEDGQVVSIVREIEKMSPEERSQTAIAYRDRICSILLTESLEEKGIPFNVISGYMPFSHELYGHVQNVLDLLFSPYDSRLHLYLYKVLPISKLELYDILGWDQSKGMFKGEPSRVHFKHVDFGRFSTYQTFSLELSKLAKISEMIHSVPLKEYFPLLFEMILKFFWNFKMSNNEQRESNAIDALFTSKVARFFYKDMLYDELFKELSRRRDVCRRYNESKVGVTLSTFHGLKGLEYDNLYMTYMDDAIFPSQDYHDLIEDLDEIENLTESERRLCYVAMTRPRKKLVIYYPTANPSTFVKTLMSKQNKETQFSGDKTTDEGKINISDIIQGPDVTVGASPNAMPKSGYLNTLFKQF